MARRRPLVGVGVLLLLMGLSTCTQPSGSAPNGGAQVQILQGSTMMTTGSGYNFGSEALYAPSNPVTFTVKNVGSSTVILDASTPFSISGTNAADFGPQGSSVSIAPGSSTTFSMTFTPSILAAESAVGTVNSNAGSFSFALNGTGAASGGITLAWGPTNSSFPNPISNGGSTPGAYPSFYSTGPWPDICYFQITNTSSTGQLGVGTVTISSNTSSGLFVVNVPPTPAVPASSTETFEIEVASYLGVTTTYTETVTLKTSSTNTPDRTFTFSVTNSQC